MIQEHLARPDSYSLSLPLSVSLSPLHCLTQSQDTTQTQESFSIFCRSFPVSISKGGPWYQIQAGRYICTKKGDEWKDLLRFLLIFSLYREQGEENSLGGEQEGEQASGSAACYNEMGKQWGREERATLQAPAAFPSPGRAGNLVG